MQIHQRQAHAEEKTQNFKGTLADKAVQKGKLKSQQDTRPIVHCEGKALENVFTFKYLGSLFAANGQHSYDIKARIAKAQVRCGQLRSIFDSPKLNVQLKIRLYIAAICSLMTFGSETWDLTPAACRLLNNANSLMLARITGKSIREEARTCTTSFNFVHNVRRRRLKWLGKILRSGEEKLTYNAIIEQHQMNRPGNLLMDAPPHSSLTELQLLSQD